MKRGPVKRLIWRDYRDIPKNMSAKVYQNISTQIETGIETAQENSRGQDNRENIKTRFHSCVGHVLRREEEAVELLKVERRERKN